MISLIERQLFGILHSMGFSKLFETSAATMPTKTFPNLIAVQSVAIL